MGQWLYSFGGAVAQYNENQCEMIVERLDTNKLMSHDKPEATEYNRNEVEWEFVTIKNNYKTCCQQGVIPLMQT